MPKRKLENKTIEVILLENDRHLGEKYEVVRVAPIYARNVLLPKGKVVVADKMNLHNYMAKMKTAEEARKQKASNINDLMKKINEDGGLNITGKVNEKGTLYAKIDEKDLVALIKDTYNIDVEVHWFKMKKKFVEAGDYSVMFEYRDVMNKIAVKVTGEMDEAAKKKMEEGKTQKIVEDNNPTDEDSANKENTEEKIKE